MRCWGCGWLVPVRRRGHRRFVPVRGWRDRWLVPILVLVATRSATGARAFDGNGSGLCCGAIRVENTQAVGMLVAVPIQHKDHLAMLERSSLFAHFAVHQEVRTRLKIEAREADGRACMGMSWQRQCGLSHQRDRVSP